MHRPARHTVIQSRGDCPPPVSCACRLGWGRAFGSAANHRRHRFTPQPLCSWHSGWGILFTPHRR